LIRHQVFVFVIAVFLISCATKHETANFSATHQEQRKVDSCEHTETSFQCVKVVEVYDGDSIFIDLPDQHPLFGKRSDLLVENCK